MIETQMEKIKGQWILAKCYETNALRLKQIDATWSEIIEAIANCYTKTSYATMLKMMTGTKNEKKCDTKEKIKKFQKKTEGIFF
jgi:hypothetical protein